MCIRIEIQNIFLLISIMSVGMQTRSLELIPLSTKEYNKIYYQKNREIIKSRNRQAYHSKTYFGGKHLIEIEKILNDPERSLEKKWSQVFLMFIKQQ